MAESPEKSRSNITLPRVRTPCIGVCSTGIGDTVCRGCKRFAHEVIDWNAYSETEKRIVDDRLAQFLAQCVANRFTITDARLLRWQLDVQQVRFNPIHNEYCWLFSLLKAGASQITEPDKYGFAVLPEWHGMTLLDLREAIDRDFWVLSVAHFDRYHATADLFAAESGP